VYCYESDAGFETHVASRRHSLPIPEYDISSTEAFLTSQKAREAAFAVSVPIPIGLPNDGESFVDATESEMFERLRELQAMGYLIPEWVFQVAHRWIR
jgi:hypothetical protein